jgi:hypothetical protein
MLARNGLLGLVDDVNNTNPVVVAVTFDGGKISRFFFHVTGGFKQVDPRCKDPRTGALLFSCSGNENVQSHVHCFPLKVCFSKDTKHLYRLEFEDFFAFLKAYELEDNWSRGYRQFKKISVLLLHGNERHIDYPTAKGEVFPWKSLPAAQVLSSYNAGSRNNGWLG